jgi:F0F1-type ATP synthase membrane subunit b/b'
MISNEKIRPYIFAFLAFCVFSSKNIIIYNEETLVAISFVAFVFFVYHYFGNTIKASFDERSQGIQMELQNFLTLKSETLKELYKEHQRVKSLVETLNLVFNYTLNDIKKAGNLGKLGLKQIISSQIKSRLNSLSFSREVLQQKLQELVAKELFSAVLIKSSQLKKNQKIKDKKNLISKIKGLVKSNKLQ